MFNLMLLHIFFFFQAEDGIRDYKVTGVQTCALPISRCYWIEMTKFDPKQRNDVLKSTRVAPGSGASLALGPFGYDPLAEGAGVLVGWLPANYHGPLKLNDRIVSVAGKELRDGRDYAQ